jgi:hypothetical protein
MFQTICEALSVVAFATIIVGIWVLIWAFIRAIRE